MVCVYLKSSNIAYTMLIAALCPDYASILITY